MPASIAPVPVRLPTAVTFPSDGEAVDRASTLEAGTLLANGLEYVSRVIDLLTGGGSFFSQAALSINNLIIPTPGTAPVQVAGAQGLAIAGPASAGSLSTTGRVTAADGWVPRRILIASTDSDLTVKVADYDVVVLPAGVWTAGHNVTLSHVGALPGVSEIEVINYNTLQNVYVRDGDPTVALNLIPPASGATPLEPTKKRFMFIAVSWVTS